MIVLIAEIEQENRELLSRLVQLHGHDPVTASNASEAIEQVRRYRPDLIFVDASTFGEALVTVAQNDAALAHVPIVAFAEDATNAGSNICLESVCDEVMKRPLDIGHLQFLIDQYAALAPGNALDLEVRHG